VNKSGQSTGEAVTATYKFVHKRHEEVRQRRLSGRVRRFISTSTLIWLSDRNNITVEVVGANSLAATTVGITYQVVDLQLSDTTDLTRVIQTS
jgi:hypothetical protein